jgi:hypothetical protein
MTRRRVLAVAAVYLVGCWALIGWLVARAVSS